MVKPFFFLLVVVVFITGCQKDATNIKLPETNSKLVIGCFISPQDSLITVTATRSNPIFGVKHNTSSSLLVIDATVIISDGTSSITIPYNSVNEQYELQTSLFPIVAGKTYYLNVYTPKGENVSANCTVPTPNLSSLTIDFIDTVSSTKKVNVKWQDIPNQINYYRIYGQMVVKDVISDDGLYDMYANNSVINDDTKDGKEIYASLEGYYYGFNVGGQVQSAMIAYDIYLLTIDKEYYKYQNSLDNYAYDDPFSEPSPLYTNIKGGLGIFGAYQKLYVRK